MTNRIKSGLKMIKYAYSLKTFIFLGFIIFASGILLELLNVEKGIGSYFIILTGMWIPQLLYLFSASNLVQSSPYKKCLQTTIPVIISYISIVLLYLFDICLKIIVLNRHPEAKQDIIAGLLFASITGFVLMIYIGMAYKYFYISLITFLAFYLFAVKIYPMYLDTSKLHLSLPVASIIGFIILSLGALVQYGVSILIYKKQLSKAALPATLRKSL